MASAVRMLDSLRAVTLQHRKRRQLHIPTVHLTLFIPDLLPPHGAESAIADNGLAPALRRIYGRGTLQRFPAIAAEIWLCQAFAVEPREDWPVAALTATVDGLATASGCWLRADPVHLQLQRSQTLVLAAPELTLNEAEAHALAGALNAHFSTDGIALTAAHPERWYIRQTESIAVASPVLSAVAGRPLPRAPLTGSQASHWHRVLTEAQMVLHEHPVNLAREARGVPVVNSVLLWGSGRMPAVPGRNFSHVWTDAVLATALAMHSGADPAAAPASAALWFGNRPAAEGRHLITLDRVHHAARYGGPEAWVRAVAALEATWFAPLWAALGSGGLKELVIVATGPELGLRCTLRPADKLKFWRRPPTWAAIAGDPA